MVAVAKLTADLSVNSSAFEAGLRRASSTLGSFSSSLNNTMAKNGRTFTTFNSSLSTTQTAIRAVKAEIVSLGSVAAGALSVQKIIQYSDTWKQLEGRLRIVSETSRDVAAAQDRLFDIAQNTRQPLEAVTSLYTRLNIALGENKRANFDVAGITETISKALAVTGEGASQSASAILQFSQAVSSDFKASAQEINSLLDSAPRLALALQKSFGDGSKSLKQLAADGDLSTEKVLRALEPIAAQAQEIGREFGQMQLTVSQAMTQLDNAFLQYIGRTDAIKSGTSSLALGISALANNFGLLANTATLIAAVFGARLIGALGKSAILWAANTAEATAYNLALARMAGVSATAATGLLAASRAGIALRAALAFIGGPIGAAFLAVGAAVYYLANAQSAAEKTAESYAGKISRLVEINNELAQGSNRRSVALAKERDQIILTALAENKATAAKIAALQAQQALLPNGGGQRAAVDGALNQQMAIYKAQSDALRQMGDELQDEINRRNTALASGDTAGETLTKKQIKSAEQLIRSLQKQNEELRLKNQLAGESDAILTKAQLRQDVENQIIDQNIKLTAKQRAEIEGLVSSIEDQTDASEALASRQELLSSVTDNLSSSLMRGVTSWGELKEAALDALGSIIQQYVRMQTATAGGSSGGGLLGSLISGISGFFGFGASVYTPGSGGFNPATMAPPSKPSFATGIANVPYDMTANIHKGEAVLTAGEAAEWRAGATAKGGDIINIDARGAAPGVEQQIRNIMSEVNALRHQVPSISVSAVAAANKRNPRLLGT